MEQQDRRTEGPEVHQAIARKDYRFYGRIWCIRCVKLGRCFNTPALRQSWGITSDYPKGRKEQTGRNEWSKKQASENSIIK